MSSKENKGYITAALPIIFLVTIFLFLIRGSAVKTGLDNFFWYTGNGYDGDIYTYFRMLSRNISRRYNENQIYLKYRYKVIAKFNGFKARMRDRKTHRVFKCPGCSQKIRVPRGKGRISIKCPKCRIEFIKRT